MNYMMKDGLDCAVTFARCLALAPEAFRDDRVLNLWGGAWVEDDIAVSATSPIDGTPLAGPPMIGRDVAANAMRGALDQHSAWSHVSLRSRAATVARAVDSLEQQRDLLALLLVWEIGKPWALATADVDRCIVGVRWYLEEIERMTHHRTSLEGPVSNIAGWTYPMSVLMHGMLVQVLAGNAVIAKAPTQGGVACLTLACALAAREGLPVTLVSGSGQDLSPVLVGAPQISCVSFVGGRGARTQVAAPLAGTRKRYMIEQEGLNCWGLWEFSQRDLLARHLHKGFEYGKQRCTAYPRYVVPRRLFDQFLVAYLPVVESVNFGHPLAVEAPGDALPALDFGPLINEHKAKELNDQVDDAISNGGIPLYRGSLDDGRFLPDQRFAAYVAPSAILEPPQSSRLHHAEPFGPVDTIVLVDTEAELLAAMNTSNGSLVASLACDDEATAQRLGEQVQAFKVGINSPRSRGDNAEAFGGKGASWRGAFVGGDLLVQAVTAGPNREYLHGNFSVYSLYPSKT